MKGAASSRTQIHLPARMLKNNEKKVATRPGGWGERARGRDAVPDSHEREFTDRGNVDGIFAHETVGSKGAETRGGGARFPGAPTWKIAAT